MCEFVDNGEMVFERGPVDAAFDGGVRVLGI